MSCPRSFSTKVSGQERPWRPPHDSPLWQPGQDRRAAFWTITPTVAHQNVAAGAAVRVVTMLDTATPLDRQKHDPGNKICQDDQPANRRNLEKIVDHALTAAEQVEIAGEDRHNPRNTEEHEPEMLLSGEESFHASLVSS